MNTDKTSTNIVPFQKIFEIGPLAVGNKAYNLGMLLLQNVPVPQGFVVTTDAFDSFMRENEIFELGISLIQKIDKHDRVILEKISKQIKKRILSSKISDSLFDEVSRAYSHLSGFSETFVAVRSSSTYHNHKSNDDSKFDNYMNIKGIIELVDRIKDCWASQFSADVIENVLQRSLSLSHLKMAVMVQKMVQAEVSGVMYTVNPIDHDKSDIHIEAILGLGEILKELEITPDTYIVAKSNNEIKSKNIVSQEWMYVRQGKSKRNENPNIRVNISPRWQKMQKLEDKYILSLVELGKGLEKIFEDPLEVEWAYESGKIWIVEAKALTSIPIRVDIETSVDIGYQNREELVNEPKIESVNEKVNEVVDNSDILELPGKPKHEQKLEDMPEEETELVDLKNLQLLLNGDPGGKGVSYGVVKVVNTNEDLESLTSQSIVVTNRITSVWVEKLKNIAGIITDEGGESLLLAKDLGLTAVVATQIGSKVLKDGEVVTISGLTGDVYEGSLHPLEITSNQQPHTEIVETTVTTEVPEPVKNLSAVDSALAEIHELPEPKQAEEEIIVEAHDNKIITATKIYLDLNSFVSPDQINMNLVDGVAVLHSNSLLGKMGIHPDRLITSKKDGQKFTQAVYYAISGVAEKVSPLPVIYQLSDLLSHEYAQLDGGQEIETSDLNPLLGKRSIDRFIEKPELVKLELDAVKDARNKIGLRNLWVSIPYVRTSNELREMKQIISSLGLRRSSTFKLFLNLTTPANIVTLEELINIDIDGLILDIDSLNTLMLGIDWKNAAKPEQYSSESIKWAVNKALTIARKTGVSVIVKGDILQNNPDIIKECIEMGVSGISVNRNFIREAKNIVAGLEHKMILTKKSVKKKSKLALGKRIKR